MTAKQFKKKLIELDACDPAKEWADGKSWQEVYDTCHRGDWLLWLAKRAEIDSRTLILVCGHCANTVRHLMADERSTTCVDACIAYGEGKIVDDELRAAAVAAADAAWASEWAAWASAREENQRQTADIVRKYIPIEKFKL